MREGWWVLPLSVLAFLIFALTDAFCPGVQSFWGERPMLTTLIAGILIVLPLGLGLEAHIRRRTQAKERAEAEAEEQRWRQPAIDGIETLMFTADQATDTINDLVNSAADQHLGGKGTRDLEGILVDLTQAKPDWFDQELRPVLQQEANRIGTVALQAQAAIARYPPLSSYVVRFSSIQRSLRDMARKCREIAVIFRAQQTLAREAAVELAQLARQRAGELQDMSDDLFEEKEAIDLGPPPPDSAQP